MVAKKVRILVSIASAEWSYALGDEVEIDDKLADAWVESGIAEPLETSAETKKRGKK